MGGEFGGLVLIGIAMLSGVALATYSPADLVFELAPVANRAGPVGATIAGWLFGAVGWGAVVVVAAVGWVGGCLVLGRGLPRVDSRFSVGSTFLLVSVATLPPAPIPKPVMPSLVLITVMIADGIWENGPP